MVIEKIFINSLVFSKNLSFLNGEKGVLQNWVGNGVGWDHWGNRGRGVSIRDVARAGRGQFVGIDEKSTVGVTGVKREHSVVDILLGTF